MEPGENKWQLVIKVKHGDTLRRFSTSVHGMAMDHNISKIRDKIISLFKFSPDADLILTYTDEDGDDIILDDDDELLDAIINQHLNPLRINIQLNTCESSDPKSQRTSCPPAGPQQIETGPSQISYDTDEALKSVPKPFHGALSMLPQDLLLNSASSAPSFAKFVDYFPKFGLSHGSMPSYRPVGESSGTSTGTLTNLMNLSVSDEPKASTGHVPVTIGSAVTSSDNPVYEHLPKQNAKVNMTSVPGVVYPTFIPYTDFLRNHSLELPSIHDFYRNHSSDNPVYEHLPKQNAKVNMTSVPGVVYPTYIPYTDFIRNHSLELPSIHDYMRDHNYNVGLGKDGGDNSRDRNSDSSMSLSAPPLDQTVELNSRQFVASNPSVLPNRTDGVAEVSGVNNSKQYPFSTIESQVDSSKLINATPSQVHNSQFDAHFKTNISVPTPEVPISRVSFPAHPYRTMQSYHDSMGTFHRGVQCDGCGIYPIIGPRFKSNVMGDYDLCSSCLPKMGNEADHTRIEQAPYYYPRLSEESYNPIQHSRYGIPSLSPFHGYGMRASKGKLESPLKLGSCFIKDVTFVDGTVMPPCTPFTKIWRMRNNGTISWPYGTQLVWVYGNRFGNQGSAKLEIPMNGCPVGEEIDISVAFTTPSEPGRHISYWRMASPSGQQFGQHVWAEIQVENPQPNSGTGDPDSEVNLNLLPESSAKDFMGSIVVNAEPLDVDFTKPVANAEADSSDNAIPGMGLEPFLTNGLSDENDYPESSSNAAAVADALQSEEATDEEATDEEATDEEATDEEATDEDATDDNLVEQTLLNELEQMGFEQTDLNKKVLRMNDYDLPQSIDDLCCFDEWDPLNELQEMGFYDEELNKKLLAKNGGSIKQVVLDLISGKKVE